jgi:phage portal protein BeeE
VASIIDRLLANFNRVDEPEAKAALGPGAYALGHYTPLWQSVLSRDPNRLMTEAQALYRQPWVNVAERAVTARFVRLPWHLEDGDGETIDDTSDEAYRTILRLVERPNQRMTRRQLWSITLRHIGLCGNAFWYLDQRDLAADTPLQILYINPARMTPSVDAAGNVTGWVVDDPQNSQTGQNSERGIPLQSEEVIHFRLDEPDFGVWGIGLAEAAQRKIDLSRITDTYIGQVLGTGGRITGILAPKDERTQFTDDEFQQYANDWRRIVDDPQAAKRMQISKKPVEMIETSMSPRDLLLPDVSKMSRDDVLGMWGIPLSQVGIPVPAGLNSGERGKYDEAAMYEGGVQPRGEAFREKVQYELLDRFNGLGLSVQLVIEFPTFDDLTPLYENADKAKVVPRKVNESRESVGLDPLDEAIYGKLGDLIVIDKSMVILEEPPEAEPEPVLLPPPPPGSGLPSTDEEEEEVVEGKADFRKPLLGLRSKTEATWEPRLRKAVAKVLGEQRKYVLSKLEHATRKNDMAWWSSKREDRRFLTALEPLLTELATDVSREARKKVGKPEGKADSFLERVLEHIREAVGVRISGINAVTLDKIRSAVRAGVEAGESPADIGRRIQESAAFDEYRAELISRTETMNVYNDAALRSYGELEVAEVEAIDGDEDAECAARNGKRYPIDEAYGISDHPNGTLDWVPVVKADIPPEPMLVLAEAMKANLERPQPVPQVFMESPVVHNHIPEQPAPQVHVDGPTINLPEQPIQPAPQVNVSLPEQKASLPAQVEITAMPKRVKKATRRNSDGTIESMEETDG